MNVDTRFGRIIIMKNEGRVMTVIMITCLAALRAIGVEAAPMNSVTGDMQYLSQFGYLRSVNPGSEEIMSKEAMSRAIAEFQSFVGINVTGNMDTETAHMMTLPRCGVKDIVGPMTSGRAKRYALRGSEWKKKNLTYKITKYSSTLDSTAVDAEIARAFAVWSEYTDLKFLPKSEGVDIEIRFERGDHGDGHPFERRGSSIAHSLSPAQGGGIHFHDGVGWTINSTLGSNLFQTAVHVIGHSLGLDHSPIQSSVMHPNVQTYNPNFKLHSDDIAGIQALYGPKVNEVPQICEDPSVDTMFTYTDGHTYAFKGNYYWKLTTNAIAAQHPKPIAEKWSSLPGNIDAAFTYGNNWTYFFKGSKYWRYDGDRMSDGFPREISQGFPGIPDNVDAATVWTGDGKIYFFKGTEFWKFDFNQRAHSGSISEWKDLPGNLDAAVVYNGKTFFFKGGSYYRFNDRNSSVDRGSSAFPRPNGIWFDCQLLEG